MIPSEENLLRTFLDPVAFMESFIKLETPDGMQPWDMDLYQKHLVRDVSRNRAINKSKKTGISTTIAGESIFHTFTKAGSQIMFVSCYDDQTKAYTKKGLKSYNELAIGDEVLSLNVQTNNIEWKPVEKINIVSYSGSMVAFKGRSTNLLVTPNHKMFVKTKINNTKSKIKIIEAQNCLKYKRVYTASGVWQGVDAETLEFNSKKYRTEDIFYLVGLYIGDGFLNYRKTKKVYTCSGMRLCIPETDKSQDNVISLFQRMDIRCYRNIRFREKIRFHEKPLIKLFEECGHGAKNKKIPEWMLGYSQKYLEFLLQGLLDSDGDGQRVLHTISLPLTTQCIELAIKLKKTVCFKKYPAPQNMSINGRKFKSTNESYVLSFSRGEHEVKLHGNNNLQYYNGIVWCPVIKDNHNLLVERNGKICFSGNTGQRIAEELLGKWYDMLESLPDALKPRLTKQSAEVARLPNGSRVMSLPSSDPAKIRGLGLRGGTTDVYLDEYAYTDNDNELWIVVKDFQILGGRITLNSTPKGNRGKYYQIVAPLQAAYQHLIPKDPKNVWSYHEIPYWHSPRLRDQKAFLMSETTDIDFRQEYCVEFIDESMSFFPYELLAGNQTVDNFILSGSRIKNVVQFGIDFGKMTSETIIWVSEKISHESWKTLYIEVLPGVDYETQVETIVSLFRDYRPTLINIDASGPGGQAMNDYLSKDYRCGNTIIPFNLTSSTKENIIVRTHILMQRKRFAIPKKDFVYEGNNLGEKVEKQFHGILRTTTEAGLHTRYSGKETVGYDDMVWAGALSVYEPYEYSTDTYVSTTQDSVLAKMIKDRRMPQEDTFIDMGIPNW